MNIPDDVYKATVRRGGDDSAIVLLHRKRRFWRDSHQEYSRHIWLSHAHPVCNEINAWIRERDHRRSLPAPKGWKNENL